ncbi:unnamed protein product [Durusdinium trenchii]|uniref:Uncharacterized protein n=1 Tax=Durusdinium trenchii TaxID=1381693 RepID=A0ABP0SYQ1_9DINO
MTKTSPGILHSKVKTLAFVLQLQKGLVFFMCRLDIVCFANRLSSSGGCPQTTRWFPASSGPQEAVSTYKGEPDSILGTTFVSFLVLLLFIWGMLMIKEFLYIYNFMYVVWYMPSTTDDDENFASVVDGKILVRKMPSMHKIFGLVCVALPRLVIAVVILTVGASFLSATNNLQDLVLNSTALCFLIEVDNMIHASFLGENFEKHVTDQCDAIKVPSSSSGTWQPYLFLAVALFTTAGWTGWSYFNRRGLAAIGTGMECLCHFAGDCYASSFVSTS